MWKNVLIFRTAFSCLLVASSFFAEKAHATRCEQLLNKNLLDINHVMSSRHHYLQIRNWMCSEKLQSYAGFKDRARNVGIDLTTAKYIFGFDGSDKDIQESFSKKYEKWCRSGYSDRRSRNRLTRFRQRIGPDMVKIAKACFKQRGTFIQVIPDAGLSSFQLKVTRLDTAGGKLKINSIEMSRDAGAVCSIGGKPLISKTSLRADERKKFSELWNTLDWSRPERLPYTPPDGAREITLTCYKYADREINVTINTSRGGSPNPVKVPGRRREKLLELEERLARLESRVLHCTVETTLSTCRKRDGYSAFAYWGEGNKTGGKLVGHGGRISLRNPATNKGYEVKIPIVVCCKFMSADQWGSATKRHVTPIID